MRFLRQMCETNVATFSMDRKGCRAVSREQESEGKLELCYNKGHISGTFKIPALPKLALQHTTSGISGIRTALKVALNGLLKNLIARPSHK